jgi:hypothetical protein
VGGCVKLQRRTVDAPRCPPNPFQRFWGVLNSLFVYSMTRSNIRPTMTVTINDTKIPALFDTGASISVISWRAFLRLSRRPRLQQEHITVKAANGKPLQVRGTALFNIQIGSRSSTRPFIVVDSLSSDLIIGSDIIAAEQLIIDVADKKIYPKHSQPSQTNVAVITSPITLQPYEEQLCTFHSARPFPMALP